MGNEWALAFPSLRLDPFSSVETSLYINLRQHWPTHEDFNSFLILFVEKADLYNHLINRKQPTWYLVGALNESLQTLSEELFQDFWRYYFCKNW